MLIEKGTSIEAISERLQEFIFEYIDTVEQVEIIALLNKSPESWIDSMEITKELRRNPTSVAKTLQLLHQRGFLNKDELNPSRYKYHGRTEKFNQLIEELLREYEVRPHAILELIFSPMKRARTFADAFRLSKSNKPNGDKNG